MSKLSNKSIVLLDQAIFSACSFLITIFLSQHLGLSLFGVYSSFILILFLIISVIQAIVIQPMQVYIAKQGDVNNYIGVLIIVMFFFAAILICLGFLVVNFNFSYDQLSAENTFPFIFFAIGFILNDFFRKILLAINQVWSCLLFDLIVGLLLVFIVFIIKIYNVQLLSQVFKLFCLAYLPAVAFLSVYFLRKIQKLDWNPLRYHLKEGKWFLMAGLSQWFSNNFFVLASGWFLSMKALGALRLVQTIFGVFNILLQSVENYIVPQLALKAQSSIGATFRQVKRKAKTVLIVSSIILSLVFIFSQEIMFIAGGREYIDFHSILRSFSVLYVLIFVFYPVRVIIRALAFNKSFFIAYFISGVFGLLFCQLAFKYFGLYAAGIGLALNQVVLLLVWVYELNRKNYKAWKLYI